MRLAFAGCGMVSELHQQALRDLPSMELIGVYDVDPTVRDHRAGAWDVLAYPSLEALLADDSVDALLVLTNQENHVAVAMSAIEAGKHVLVEKPVSSDPLEIRRLIEMAERRGVVAMPGHNYCHVPEFARAVRLARGGKLGRIRSLFVIYAIAHPETVAGPYGGVMGAVMVHHSYLALAVLGTPHSVHAGVSPTAWADYDGEDQAWMTWTYHNGAVARLIRVIRGRRRRPTHGRPWSRSEGPRAAQQLAFEARTPNVHLALSTSGSCVRGELPGRTARLRRGN